VIESNTSKFTFIKKPIHVTQLVKIVRDSMKENTVHNDNN